MDAVAHDRPCVGVAARLFATPRTDVDVICRLTLARYLCACRPTLSGLVRHTLFARCPTSLRTATSAQQEEWLALQEMLRRVKVVDPTCGRGDFLLGMLDVLEHMERCAAQHLGMPHDSRAQSHAIVERNLYGVEVQPDALSVAAQRLQEAMADHPLPVTLNLVCGDSLVERPGFSWTTDFGEVMERSGFDLVVGNPPFVRHELIDDPIGQLSKAAYLRLARQTVHRRLPDFFGCNYGASKVEHPLDGRSDLSSFFTFLGFSLLRPGGTLGFVLPATALEARYGRLLHEFLERCTRTGVILESSRQRSFRSGVNTIVLIATPESADIGGEFGSILRDRPIANSQALRVRRIRVHGALHEQNLAALALTGPPPFHRHSRGPDTLAPRVLTLLEPYITTLGSLGRLRYPIKTGINRFFYPDPETVQQFGIEAEFCRPILKSPRAVDKIGLSPGDLRSVLFACDRSLSLLEAQGMRGASAYIRWGAAQVTADGTPWPQVPSVQGRTYWYSVCVPLAADILCPRFFDRRFFFAVPTAPLLEDQTFYGLILSDRSDVWRTAMAAVLNCSLSYLFVETFGRTGLGDGVRQYALCDMAALPVVDVRSIAPHHLESILRTYQGLSTRRILPIAEEMQQSDRFALDAVVAAAFSIAETEMDAVHQALVELTDRRLQRARSMQMS